MKKLPDSSVVRELQRVKKASQSLPPAGGKEIHFLSGRVPDRKYLSGCKCAIYTPRAYKSCARQTAILLSKKGKALF